jgi:hypothetical protein
LIHGVIAKGTRGEDEGPGPLPSTEQLTALAADIQAAYPAINEARLGGFLFEALNRRPAPP